MYCAGLMLPRLGDGFTFNIIDMDNTDGDSIISLNAPEGLLPDYGAAAG